jgi:pseudaminic acid cytidylyltransferase
MSTIAVIPARGGSKRIPCKNIKDFMGQPIITYSIRVAQESRLFDHIIVSTDDAEIAGIAKSLGAKLPFLRPKELSNDKATTLEVIQHALDYSEADKICCIYATAPFLQINFLQEGLRLLEEHPDKSYAFSVTSFPFPVQRAITINKEGSIDALYPEYRQTRSQDLIESFHDAGQFYWGQRAAWKRGDPLFSSCSLPVLLPRYLVQDLDTQEDWERAEYMYKAWSLQQKKASYAL